MSSWLKEQGKLIHTSFGGIDKINSYIETLLNLAGIKFVSFLCVIT